MKKLNGKNFDQFIGNEKCIVQFSADWCGPCKILTSTLKSIDGTIDIDVGKLDIDQAIDIAKQYNVRSVPVLIFFKRGQEKARSIGAKNKDAILKFINTNL